MMNMMISTITAVTSAAARDLSRTASRNGPASILSMAATIARALVRSVVPQSQPPICNRLPPHDPLSYKPPLVQE